MTLLDGMEAFARNDGGYAHAQSDRESNFMASEQVLLAKTALLRLRQGEERLYSFEQYTGPQESGTFDEENRDCCDCGSCCRSSGTGGEKKGEDKCRS